MLPPPPCYLLQVAKEASFWKEETKGRMANKFSTTGCLFIARNEGTAAGGREASSVQNSQGNKRSKMFNEPLPARLLRGPDGHVRHLPYMLYDRDRSLQTFHNASGGPEVLRTHFGTCWMSWPLSFSVSKRGSTTSTLLKGPGCAA